MPLFSKYFLYFLLLIITNSFFGQYRGLFLPTNTGGIKVAESEERIALLIGNNNYKIWGKLDAPAEDVKLLGKALESKGFKVEFQYDLTKDKTVNVLNEFRKKIKVNTVVLFFYAGHGIEVEGNNYLIPVDDNSSCKSDLTTNALSLNYIHDKLDNSENGFNIMIIDACRNQPLPFSCPSETRSIGKPGFSEYSAKGSFIAFSTSPGTTALDRMDGKKNSPYALALFEGINTPGKKIEDVFKDISRKMDAIGQRPWVNNSFTGDFYFEYFDNNNSTNDSDKDGIIDSKDDCPNEPGPIENRGCPFNTTIVSNEIKTTANYSESALRKEIESDLVILEGGSFDFAVKDKYGTILKNEKRIVSSFAISKHEVTNEQYAAFLTEYGSEIILNGPYKGKTLWNKQNISIYKLRGKWIVKKGEEKKPCSYVSWFAASAFCDFYGYSLPTEIQWEFAAKGGKFNDDYDYSGSKVPEQVANFQGNSSNELLDIGQKLPNNAGIYDMSGNVSEWCEEKVTRGGSFFDPTQYIRVTTTLYYASPEYNDKQIGFRVIKKL